MTRRIKVSSNDKLPADKYLLQKRESINQSYEIFCHGGHTIIYFNDITGWI